MFCPKCGKDAGEAKFCPECGEKLATQNNEPANGSADATSEQHVHEEMTKQSVNESRLNCEETHLPQAKKKNKKIVIIAVVVIVAAVAVIITSIYIHQKKAEPANTEELQMYNIENDIIEEAESRLSPDLQLQSNTESAKKIISDAQNLIDAGNYKGAFDLIRDLPATDELHSMLEICRQKLLEPYEGKFEIDDDDDMSDYYFIKAPNQSLYNHIYIERSKKNDAEIDLVLFSANVHSSSDGMMNPSSVRIKGDSDTMLDIEVSYSERNCRYVKGKGQYLEYINVLLSDENAETLMTILKDTSTLRIRHQGSSMRRDNQLTEQEITDMQKVADYYALLRYLY